MTGGPDVFVVAGPNGAGRSTFIARTLAPTGLDLVDAGYRVHLRVLLVPVELALARVAQRVAEGGHDVPDAKVRDRHARLWAHVAAAIDLAYDARVYDSSGQRGRPFLEVARNRLGTALWTERWPDWTPPELRRT